METQSTFAVKFHGSSCTHVENFETFDGMNDAAMDYESRGGRCDAFELKNGKTFDAYTGEEVLENKF